MRKYTEEIHGSRLRKILEREKPCECCPAANDFNAHGSVSEFWDWDPDPCFTCTEFLGLSHSTPAGNKCPCLRLGAKRAIELSWLKLEEKGYLK